MNDIGIDFRNTPSFAVDPANCTYCIGDTYPTTRLARTFGWDGNYSTGDNRDRNAAFDPRLAGINSKPNTGTQAKWRMDLINPGDHLVRWALGDASGQAYVYARILDDTLPLLTVDDTNGVIPGSGGLYDDVNGVEWSDATWAGSNTPATLTFSSTIFYLVLGSPTAQANGSPISHVFLTEVAAALTVTRSRKLATQQRMVA